MTVSESLEEKIEKKLSRIKRYLRQLMKWNCTLGEKSWLKNWKTKKKKNVKAKKDKTKHWNTKFLISSFLMGIEPLILKIYFKISN